MGRKALLAVVCWLTLAGALGEAKKNVNSSIADNASEESAPQLYRKIPAGVYASGAPYGSYSFHAPTVISAPAFAGSQVKPTVLQDSGFLRSLKDSYGKFVQTPQTAAYKTAFPQQYVQLQELPAHLSQPLIAAAPSFQYKQTAPHFFFGSQQYRIPSLHQAATPTPITRFTSLSQPLVYAENIRSFAPSSDYHVHRFPSLPQHSVNAHTFQGHTATIQRLQERPQQHVVSDGNKDAKQQATHNENSQIEAAPAQTSVTALVNGKPTVITLETKPPLPLLDLNLLEPLTFDNPLVPQVQHFLPRINSATYHTLPQFINDEKKRQKEIIVTKTNSYDSGPIVGKPKQAPKKKQNKPRPQIIPARPTVTVEDSPNASPEISYEINQPGYKETYNEQVVSYNKKTGMKPVTFSYNEQTHKEPVTYSFSHSSKEPLQVKHVEYESDPENPKQLIYKLQPEEQEEEDDERPPPLKSEDSGESSAESEEEEPASQPQRAEHHSHHEDSPRHSHHSGHHENAPKHHSEHQRHHGDPPRHSQHHSEHHHNGDSPRHHSEHHSHHNDSPRHPQHQIRHQGHHESSGHPHHGSHHSHHEQSPKNSHRHGDHHGKPPSHSHRHSEYHGKPPSHTQYHEGPPRQTQHHGHHRESYGSHESPRHSHHLRPEHREEEHHHIPNQEVLHEVVHQHPNQYSQPLIVTVQNGDFHPIITEYEEDIRLLPPEQSAPIKVDPNQHVQLGPSTPHQSAPPSPAPQKLAHNYHEQEPKSEPHSRPHSSPAPHIIEKSKHVIIKEDEETPDELHSHAEELMAQMLDKEENNEEDFEKAYKESAFGFPAYEESSEVEKDVYNPESYGTPRFHNEYNIESNPFQQYQEEGDEFPKSSRANYKDIRDKTKEDYFSEFSATKPESFSDRYRQKEDYFKTYKHNTPEKFFAHNDEKKKNKKSEKFVAAPTFLFHTSSKPKQKQYFSPYKAAPKAFAFEFPTEAPRDNRAYGSRLFHRYKTHFVEPQFQYGFEPIAAPILLDSELAAMASNNSPETEKPGIRKKIYKENWYIKKTSTTAGKPS